METSQTTDPVVDANNFSIETTPGMPCKANNRAVAAKTNFPHHASWKSHSATIAAHNATRQCHSSEETEQKTLGSAAYTGHHTTTGHTYKSST